MSQHLRNPGTCVGSTVGLIFAGALSVAAGVLGVATTTFGADAPPSAQCSCGGKDIDLAKMDERAAKEFTAADTNHDGKISLDEFLAFTPQRGPGGPGAGRMGMGMGMMGGGWMGHDHGPDDARNADWQKQREAQQRQFQSDLFKALDTDHDGQISQAEFAKAPEVAGTLMKKQMFAKMDTNHDGYLEKNEFPPYAQKLSAMDTNGDGVVSRDEMKAAHAAKGVQNPPSSPSN
jgi:Ca2+-binding EF-hand superfamily protein